MGMVDALSGSEFDDRPPDDVREDVDVKGWGADLKGEVGHILPVVLLIDVTREKRGREDIYMLHPTTGDSVPLGSAPTLEELDKTSNPGDAQLESAWP